MGKFIDLTGKRFGMLTVMERVPVEVCSGRNQGVLWICKCDCGKTTKMRAGELKRRILPNCGCYLHNFRVKGGKKNKKHGKKNTRLYGIYMNMKARCNNPNEDNYFRYGGRGIKVCDEWLNDFMNFYTWSMKNGYQDNLTIDRINNDGDYEPSNCRWATTKQQANNRRTNKFIEYNGETHTISEWSDILNIPKHKMYKQIKKGLTIDEIKTSRK